MDLSLERFSQRQVGPVMKVTLDTLRLVCPKAQEVNRYTCSGMEMATCSVPTLSIIVS